MKKAVVLFGCLAASMTWGRSFSIDLRRPAAQAGVRAVAKKAAPSAAAEDPTCLRRVSLDAGCADVGAVEVGDELSFTLFDDVAVALTLTERMPSPLGGDVFLAEASGYEGVRNAVVLRTEDGLTVDIQDYNKGLVYKVISSNVGVTVQEIKPTTDKKCGCDTRDVPSSSASEMVSSSMAHKAKSVSGTPEPLTVDILVAYDTTAAKWAKDNGGGLKTFAETAVQKMNTAIYNSLGGERYVSDYLFKFRLVGIYEIGGPGFVEGTDPDEACDIALDAAQGGTYLNGVSWAGIADKRDEVGADIVVTLIDIGRASGTVGIGFAFKSTSSEFSKWAYNCCAIRSVHESHTMTHECGHNMGAGHATAVNPRKIEPGPQFYSYSAGYYFKAANTNCHTIMAYSFDGFGNSYREVPYFSSPDVSYAGVKVGDSSHNNSLTLLNNYAVVAAFRKSKEEMEEEPPDEEPPVETGAFGGLTWRTCERFPWQVCTNWQGEVYMCSGDFRTEGGAPLTGESWIETSVTGPTRLAFSFDTYMMEGPFKVMVDGRTEFSTRDSIQSWADVDVPDGTHDVRFVFVANGWYCSDDTYNGVWLYDVRIDDLDYRPVIVPASTDSEYTATKFTAPLEVQITNSVPTSVIFYTLDGSEPTAQSTVYAGPIVITNSTIVRAVARQSDGLLTMPVASLYLERHPVQPGEWTADAEGALSAAAVDGNLVVVQYSRSYKGVCHSDYSYTSITEGDEFTNWARRNGVYLIAYDGSDEMYGRGRFLEEYSAYRYYSALCGSSYPAIGVARAWLPREAIGMSSLEHGSYVGGVRYDGTAATLIKGLETYLKSEQRPDGREVVVSFDVQGGAMEQTNRLYKSGQPFGVLPVPERRLYRFDGWLWNRDDASKRLSDSGGAVSEDELVPFADVNLYASWTYHAVKVVFDWHCHDGTNPEYRSYDFEAMSYTADGTYDEFPEWSRRGYQFAGWFSSPEGGSRISLGDELPKDVLDYAVTNHAHWTANNYKVVFHSNATDEYPVIGEMADQDFVYDTAQNLSPNRFSRPGYEFQGWSTFSNYNYVSYLNGALVTNLTHEANGVKDLYAVWQAKGYAVRFNANDEKPDSQYPATGEMQKQFFGLDEEKPLAKNLFSREGFTFGGWATYAESVAAHYKDEQNVKGLSGWDGGIVDLYAFWLPKKVTITFRDDRKHHKKQTVVEYTVATVFHNVPVHVSTEAHFNGWFTAPSGGERIQLGKTLVPAQDATYYAQWTESGTGPRPPADPDVCTVTFDANGGEITSGESVWMVERGSALGEIGDFPEATLRGQVLDGWWTAEEGGSQLSHATIVTDDMTCYAHWVVDMDLVAGLTVSGPELIDLYDVAGGNYKAVATCRDGTKVDVTPIWSVSGTGIDSARMSEQGELRFYDGAHAIYECTTVAVTAVYGGLSNSTQTVIYGPGHVTVEKMDVQQNAVWPGCSLTVTPKAVRWWRHGVQEEPTSDLSGVAFSWGLSCPGDEDRSGDGTSFTVPSDAVSADGTCSVAIYARPDRERYYYLKYGLRRSSLQFYASRPQMVTVTFDANGGEASFGTLQCVAGKPYGAGFLPALTRAGYDGYWYTAREGGTVVGAASNAPTANTTLYAHWRETSPPGPITYTVTYSPGANGTGAQQTATKAQGVALTLKGAIFTRTGYTQTGWAASADGAKAYDLGASYTANASLTLYPFWTLNSDPVPCYVVLGAGDIVEPYAASKAVALMGTVYNDCDVVGVMELKLGKVNAQKGTGKVSGTVTTLDGKKHAIKALNLTGIDGTTPKAVALEVKDYGTMAITIGGTRFAGSMGRYHVQSANVGGNWIKGGTKVHVDATSASLPAGALEKFLPDGEPVVAAGGKWKFAKAAGVKWAKPKKGAALPEIYDEASGKGLVIDTSAGKTNLSGMKLTYTPKKGTFKGTFKVYALEGEGKAMKLKKYTVNVTGVVVDGVGRGQATCKRPAAGPWPVTVE